MLPTRLLDKEELMPSDGFVFDRPALSSGSLALVPTKVAGVEPASAGVSAAPAPSAQHSLTRRREEIRQKLLNGEKVVVDKSGSLQDPSSASRDAIQVPPGKLALPDSDDEALVRRREEIRQKLLNGKKVVVDKSGSLQDPSSASRDAIQVPPGKLALPDSDDEALARRREEIRQKLLNGEKVVVDKSGSLQDPSSANRDAIQVPPGKLAASFYWYENEPKLLEAEIAQMQRSFPQFTLQKEKDGRLAWIGSITPRLLTSGGRNYHLQVVYDHNHPHASTFGGSVKVYSVDPDLEEINQVEPLPHVLRDNHGQIYLCTSRPQDFEHDKNTYGSAATAVVFAVRWFSVFELWLNNDLSKEKFASHI